MDSGQGGLLSGVDIRGIVDVSIEQKMQEAYLDYAMSVIVSRALPDVRDGLKPVHRRILYAMHTLGFFHNKPHKKCAKVVGDVIAKYHPHGDVAIYDALVRMAQDFSMGSCLLDGQGNFGSIDNDPPAAMRYTEVRLRKIAQTMMADIEFDTVSFKDNYDGSEEEPTVLPSSFPNILVNGSDGIAVGMATSIPPHNLGEVIDACFLLISNPKCSDEELSAVIPGPDFPTRGIIINGTATAASSLAGRGSVILRGKVDVETLKSGKECVVITEVPYQVVKSRLVEKIGELVRDKKIETISNIRDESNKKGIRVVIEIKKGCSAQVTINHLYKMTSLQSFFGINAVVLHNNVPTTMGIRGIVIAFLSFRKAVIRGRFEYKLARERERAHTLVGLRVVVESTDKIIAIIRGSKDQAEAREALLGQQWPVTQEMQGLFALVDDYRNEIIDGKFRFTEEQVKAILEMRLARLTGLETQKIIDELRSSGEAMQEYLTVLRNDSKILEIMCSELRQIKEDFAEPRKTIIENLKSDTSIEELIKKEDVVLVVTLNGYIKRSPLDTYNSQRRGGKGKLGMKTNDEDDVAEVLISNTHADILLFSSLGMVYKVKTYVIPEGSAQSKGRSVNNLVSSLKPGEIITNVVPLRVENDEDFSLVFATKNGCVRRSNADDFSYVQSNGKIAIQMEEGDELVSVQLAKADEDIFLATKHGNVIRFSVDSLRVIKSRKSDGVRGITLETGDFVVSMSVLYHAKEDISIRDEYLSISAQNRVKLKSLLYQLKTNETLAGKVKRLIDDLKKSCPNLQEDQITRLAQNEQFVFTITTRGLGKRTSAYEYRITNRGGVGVKGINLTSSASIVGSFVAGNEHEILLSSTKGKMIRVRACEVSIIGRSTKGVKIFDVEKDEVVVSATRISAPEEEIEGEQHW